MVSWRTALLWVVSVGISAAACAPTASSTGYAHLNDEIKAHLSSVGLGPGDVFEVRVFNEASLSGVHHVEDDGSFEFPLVGRVQASGKTAQEVGMVLTERLQAGYLVSPSVSVLVTAYNSRKIFVLGEVRNPGTFPFSARMNIVEAIALAGGFSPTANSDFVVVTREVAGEERRIPVPVGQISKGLATNLELQSGDIIYIPDSLL